jgi:hypothetical protein
MTGRRPLLLVLAVSFAVLATACTTEDPRSPSRARANQPVDEGLAEELEEHSETIEGRLEALEAAVAAGTVGRIERIQRQPAPGWAGERIVHPTADDWEPAIATDPNEPYVYILTTRFGGEPACPSNCPDPAMILQVSADGGATWQPERYLCECRKVQWQADPLIEVVPDTGEVYAVWMNSNFKIFFSKSSDHGTSWSPQVRIQGNVAWGDKPNFATSADGQDVYVTFNGPTGGDVYASVSHDAGETWSQVKVTESSRYYFAYGTGVLPDGRAVATQISFTYSGPAGAAEGVVHNHVLISDDGGATWTDTIVDTLELGVPCESEGCYADFYDSGPALAMDEDGDLLIVYSGAAVPEGPRTVYARSSTDGGTTWSSRVALSPPGANAAFAAAAGTGNDDVRVYFADQRTGRWNVWYRTTSDLGGTWTSAVRISDATSGAVYKKENGFVEFYGDYGEIAVTSAGKTIAAWGEGESWLGPGGTWFNREL